MGSAAGYFGIPDAKIIEQAHHLGIAVGITATSVAEAKKINAAGADFVIAQGIEAGGHRGVFDPGAPDEKLPTLDLVKAIRREMMLPIVAAGGIMTGADIAAALAAGAAAVQMGTAFLTCAEAGTPPAYREALLTWHDRGTALTRAYSGRPARGIVTAFMRDMENADVLPFPSQNTLTGPMRRAAQARGDAEYQSLWAGTGYPLCRALPTAALMERLAGEAASASRR